MAESVAEKINQYKRMDIEIGRLETPRLQFSQQMNECMMVKQELDITDAKTNVFKLVGPILIHQDLAEAKENVLKRIELIQGEIQRLDNQIDRKHADMDELGNLIANEQREMQRKAAESANQIVKDQATKSSDNFS